MDKITFTDATETVAPYVTINGSNYTVNPGEYSSGTDLNATTFNNMQNNIENAVNANAPISHASSSNTYGLGSTSNYGHCKTINGLTSSAYADGESLSAYQGKVLNDKIVALTGVSLYDVDAGSSGTITLSDSAANYNWLEIYFFNSADNIYSSVKVYKPNGKDVDLSSGDYAGTSFYVKSANRTINGNTISLKSGTTDTAWSISGSTANSAANSYIKIHKVVGYK